MIKNILQVQSGVGAKVAQGKLAQFDADGLLFDVKVSNDEAFQRDMFETFRVSATIRDGEKDTNVFNDVSLLDLLKYSDHAGGFSQKLAGDAGRRFVAYVPLGNYMLEGDDTLELSIQVPGHATLVFDLEVSACDFVKLDEKIIGYESLVGNGSEVLIKDAYAVYLTTAETGSTISVHDQEREYFVADRAVIAAANALGRMETFDDFGCLYQDGSGLGQNVRIKIPANAHVLVVRGYYPMHRLGLKAESMAGKIAALQGRIRTENPEKYAYLQASGLVA